VRVIAALVTAAVVAAVAPASAATVTLATGQHVYRGQGNRSLGTLRLRHAAKLTWRHPHGGPLRLVTSAGRGREAPLVITNSRSGSVRLRAGTYRGLRTLTRGGWRITITVPARR
jgi:hypothetical protein